MRTKLTIYTILSLAGLFLISAIKLLIIPAIFVFFVLAGKKLYQKFGKSK